MNVTAIIPSRYGSSRFPGKPLAPILGRPMIQWVYERAAQSPVIDRVIVATDDGRIADVVKGFGGQVMMTRADHPSGTDRLVEVVQSLDEPADIIVNVQGDEPGLDPGQLAGLLALFDSDEVELGTLVTPFRQRVDFENPDRVKALLAENGRVLAFSRSPIPYERNAGKALALAHQHLGVYAYRHASLLRIAEMRPSPLERVESLEQLRWMEHGMDIYAHVVEAAALGVDRPEDIKAVEAQLEKMLGGGEGLS